MIAALRRYGIWFAVAVLALAAYIPALRSSPGRMPADTKLYLYLDPDRLISDAAWTFDARQFAGWVPHQIIAYLWPQGPWFSLGAAAGVPDWIVHRLWIGTLLFAAGAGVLWASRRLGLGVWAAFAAAAVYQFAPYLLPYVSRTSAMLLPWAGLGWIVGLTVLAATRSRWHHAALCALVIATVGAVNATALLMVAPAAVLWLVVAAGERRIGWGRAIATAARIGGLSLAVSLWWIVAVVLQGRHGAPVLAYSESLESVSYTSTSAEVWRGLGYWLTYVRDGYAATTSAGQDHMVSGRVIAGGFLLIVVALAGLVLTRWSGRRYAIALVVTGVVLGVGVHPFDDPSPLMNLLAGDGESGPALALRSSTRAVPVLMLGLGLGAGALVDALGTVRLAGRASLRPLAAAGVVVLAFANLPSLRDNRLVDPAIDRDEDPPPAWLDAAADLDDGPADRRVWQLPGAEFGAFRWGYTVDPPLPGLTARPLVTRDLLPLGSAGAMDLAYAMDDRFQAGVADPAAVAPIARLLGADTVWLTGDAAFERFRTPRPELTRELLSGDAGLGPAVPYGDPVANVPDIPMVDEQSVSDTRIGQPVPPVELVPVLDPIGVVRVKDVEVLLSGSGDGLVDAAAAGLIDGTELVRYTASLQGDELATAVGDAREVIVTDSNRRRAHHWRGSQDVVGFTEDDDADAPDALRRDVADERLAVFDRTDAPPATVAVQDGPVRARASGYGEPFAYRPEDRPFMAIDGDVTTAWVVGDRADPVGEVLALDIDEPVERVRLRQPGGAAAVRHLGDVTIRVDGGSPQRVTLDERSFDGSGQAVDLGEVPAGAELTITIESVVIPDPTLGPALAAVGFAEVDLGLAPTVEVVRVPTDAMEPLREQGEDTPISYVFTRLRTRPSDRWRSDPELTMVREFDVPGDRDLTPRIEVRLDQRAGNDVLAELLGIDGALASRRLTGVAAAAGWAATDGDPATAWITPFGEAVGSELQLMTDAPLSELVLTQTTKDTSIITGLRVTSAAGDADVAVPLPDATGASSVVLPEPVQGELVVEITAIEGRTDLDRRYAEPVVAPVAISEISAGPRTVVPTDVDTGCRDDLLEIDGEPVPIQVLAPVAALLAGDPVEAVACEGSLQLDDGTHLLTTEGGSGLHVDRVVLAADASDPGATEAGPTLTLDRTDRTARTATIEGCAAGCWLVLGEGYNEAWAASTPDTDLGSPQLVDGGFNGWWIEPTDEPVIVTMRWTVQTPLTIALAASALAVLACIALALLDRRPTPVADTTPARFATGEQPIEARGRWVATATWVVAAALLIGFGWALLAAVAAALLVVRLGRPRLAGLVTIGILVVMAAVIVRVVQTERPWPDAGWPSRFEWLHGLGLFAAVSLLIAAFGGPLPALHERADGAAGEDGQEG